MPNPPASVKRAFKDLVREFRDFAANKDGSPQFATVEYTDAYEKAADEVEGEDPALAEKLRMAAADFDAGCDAMQEAWSAIYEAAGSEMPARKKARAKEVLPSCLES